MQKKQSKPQISLTQQATGIVTFSAAQAKEYDDKMRITQVTNLYLLHHPWRVFLRKWFGVEIYLQGETGTRGQRRNFW